MPTSTVRSAVIALALVAVAGAGVFATKTIAAELPPLVTVPTLDVSRYAGVWYEIARYPNSFQDQCAGDVKASYQQLPSGEIEVTNSCRNMDGLMSVVTGVARPLVNGQFSKLEVRFAPKILASLPFVWGDYWVIDLAPDYQYAVVGNPGRTSLWVLARSPLMDDTTLQELLHRAAKQGFDPARVLRTPQSGKE
jgi:apolipoprotein D and lipocalin family protein